MTFGNIYICKKEIKDDNFYIIDDNGNQFNLFPTDLTRANPLFTTDFKIAEGNVAALKDVGCVVKGNVYTLYHDGFDNYYVETHPGRYWVANSDFTKDDPTFKFTNQEAYVKESLYDIEVIFYNKSGTKEISRREIKRSSEDANEFKQDFPKYTIHENNLYKREYLGNRLVQYTLLKKNIFAKQIKF
jgi:hypothetical protein